MDRPCQNFKLEVIVKDMEDWYNLWGNTWDVPYNQEIFSLTPRTGYGVKTLAKI